MPRLYRRDYGQLGAPETTPQGGLRVPAYLTRTGVFEYSQPDGSTIREYRPPSEVSKADSLATLRGATLTLDHPTEAVRPENFRTVVQGHVGDDVRMDADKVSAPVYVQDQSAIRAIQAGRRDISCGYHCDVDETPGVVPSGEPDAGMAYDRVQRGLSYNHVALVDQGRAGSAVRLRLDSAGNSITDQGATVADATKEIEVIAGTRYDIGSDAHKAAVKRRDDGKQSRKDAVDGVRKAFEAEQVARKAADARADAAEAKYTALVAKAKEMLSPARLDALAAKRTLLVGKATEIIGKDFKADGLANAQVRTAIVAKAYPDVRLDSASPDVVKGLLIAALRTAKPATVARRDAAPPAHLASPPPGAKGRTASQTRTDAMDMEAARAHRPLALSRRDKFKPLSSTASLQSSMIENQR